MSLWKMGGPHLWSVMIDIETLGSKPDAPIIEIGAVLFREYIGYVHVAKPFHTYVRPAPNARYDAEVIAFWLLQNGEVRHPLANALSDSSKLPTEDDALCDLRKWPWQALTFNAPPDALADCWADTWAEIRHVWANGTSFDIAILDMAHARSELETPWRYNAPRDLRTAFTMLNEGKKPEVETRDLKAHNALDDCIKQIRQLCKLYGVDGNNINLGELIDRNSR